MTHAYTWSHAIDTTSDQNFRDRPDDGRAFRGHADHDRRHIYVGTYVYEFPWRQRQTGPVGNIGSVNFGRVLETFDPRFIQFSLRYMF